MIKIQPTQLFAELRSRTSGSATDINLLVGSIVGFSYYGIPPEQIVAHFTSIDNAEQAADLWQHLLRFSTFKEIVVFASLENPVPVKKWVFGHEQNGRVHGEQLGESTLLTYESLVNEFEKAIASLQGEVQ